MSSKILKKPILITGAARSGTTLLVEIIDRHPNVACWAEPNIWKTGNVRIKNDVLNERNLNSKIEKKIRKTFEEFLEKKNAERLAEKTPANTLRIPFVMEIFPDSKILHIIRDGRDVALSARKQWKGQRDPNTDNLPGNEQSSLIRTLKIMQQKAKNTPVTDLPYYIPSGINSVLSRIGLRKYSMWGPKFPGISEAVKIYSLIEVCALQWKWSVEEVLNYVCSTNRRLDYFEVRYENLCIEPKIWMRKIFDFLELEQPDDIDEYIYFVKPNIHKWKKELNEEELSLIYRHIYSTLKFFEYEVPQK